MAGLSRTRRMTVQAKNQGGLADLVAARKLLSDGLRKLSGSTIDYQVEIDYLLACRDALGALLKALDDVDVAATTERAMETYYECHEAACGCFDGRALASSPLERRADA